MASKAKAGVMALVASAILLALTACGEGTSEAASSGKRPAEVVDVPTPAAPEASEALIVYLTGDVRVVGDDGERYPDIGETVGVAETVMTGFDGFVELQFGNLGAVRIGEDTEYRLETLVLAGDGGRAKGSLAAGSVVAKVRQLTGDDAFEVSAPGAVCAVRGTEFLVRADQGGSVTVAVAEGRVAVEPPSLSAAGSDPNADTAMLEEIRALVPLVEARQEIVVDRTAFAAADEEISAVIADEAAAVDVEAVKASVQKTLVSAPVPEPIREENTRTLAEQTPVLVSLKLAETADDSEAAEVPELVSLTVRTDPAEARISLNGRDAGRGRVSRIFEAGTTVSIRAAAADGRILEREVTAGEESMVELIFEEPAEDEAPAVEEPTALETAPPEPSEPDEAIERIVMDIVAEPAGATIFVDGRRQGRGRARVEGNAGERLSVRVEAPGYETSEQSLVLRSDPAPLRVALEGRVVVNRFDLPGAAVGTPASDGRRAVVATADGGLVGLDRSGRPIWVTETRNADGENTSPVLIGNRVYVIGREELVILDAGSGRIQARQELGDREDLFGRRPVSVGNRVVLPSNDQLTFVDAASGDAAAAMEIPGGSQMTPAMWNGRLLLADQRGTLLYVNPDSMSVERSVATGAVQPVAQAPAVSPSGTVVFAGRRGTVVGVDLAAGRMAWERPLSEGERIRVYADAVIAGNTAYLYGDGRVFALDIAGGSDRFAPIRGASAPPLVKGNILYVPRSDGTLALHDRQSGRLLVEIPLGETLTARPADLGDVVVAAGERRAYVVDPRSLLP